MNAARLSEVTLSRIEDAGLNASAPPQQRWVDGWLVRFSPGKAKRARCVNALTAGRLAVEDKLALCQGVYDQMHLPLIVRITPFSQPAGLDQRLNAMGYRSFDDTRVMVLPELAPHDDAWPSGATLQRVGHQAFAQTVGQLRGSPLAHRQAHAQRLDLSPVAFEGWVVRCSEGGQPVACGQLAIEGDLVGLYDIYTAEAERNRGWSTRLCAFLLSEARRRGARMAYLQVDADNDPARAVYRRLGFADAYFYHYRAIASEQALAT